jgi:hypothetical protein
LSLKVDLIQSDAVIDAEEVLAENIKDEAAHLPEVEVPQPSISDIDVTEDAATSNEFVVMELDDDMPATTIISDTDDEDAALAVKDDEEGKEA